MQAEAIVSSWGTSLGIRIPKEFSKSLGIEHKSKVQLRMQGGVLQVIPIRERRPLLDILEAAKFNGLWDGNPPNLTDEDRVWLDMSPVGAEAVHYGGA